MSFFLAFLPSALLFLASLSDIVLNTQYACFSLITLHLLLFCLQARPSPLLLVTLGFLIDIYTSHLFGLTSAFFILIIILLEKIKIIIDKLENFWILWGSFGCIMMSYTITVYCTSLHDSHASFFVDPQTFIVFLFFALYPLVFQGMSYFLPRDFND